MEGFEIPIHRSLTQKIMVAGVPREMAMINGTLCAAIVLGLHNMWGIPIGIALHIGAAALAKHDPLFFEVFRRQIKQKKVRRITCA